MKRIRKPTDKEFHSSLVQPRRKIHHPAKERSAQVVQKALPVERIQPVEWHAPSVTLSLRDRASQLILSEDQMTCKGVEVISHFDCFAFSSIKKFIVEKLKYLTLILAHTLPKGRLQDDSSDARRA